MGIANQGSFGRNNTVGPGLRFDKVHSGFPGGEAVDQVHVNDRYLILLFYQLDDSANAANVPK